MIDRGPIHIPKAANFTSTPIYSKICSQVPPCNLQTPSSYWHNYHAWTKRWLPDDCYIMETGCRPMGATSSNLVKVENSSSPSSG